MSKQGMSSIEIEFGTAKHIADIDKVGAQIEGKLTEAMRYLPEFAERFRLKNLHTTPRIRGANRHFG